jgi:alkylation response protein AidB-like acyl-CoA dehydrogenase
MDFKDSPDESRFRADVREWLQANLPCENGRRLREPKEENARAAFRLEWERKLFRGGWSGIHWPKAYGGRGATLAEYAIFLEESVRADAPEGINIPGRNLVGPTIIAHGTDEQKRRYLPGIIEAREIWCQGFSEPGAGSDLAGLRTRAVLEGEHFLVSGQKIWTSWAQYSDWCILLVRTDPHAPKHKGLSFLLVDMSSPGITVRPLRQITGESEFNEVFFDEVRVPATNVLGKLNDGWAIAMTTLSFERGPEEALARQVRFSRKFEGLLNSVRTMQFGGRTIASDPVARQKLAQTYIELEIMRLNCLRGISRLKDGQQPGPEASFVKLYWSHVYQRMTEMALEIEGPLAQIADGDPLAADDGIMQYEFLMSRASTIYSGSSEIQRNIIAERVLGLPK